MSLLDNRRKVADEVEEWFLNIEKNFGEGLKRSVFDIITALHILGYYEDPQYPYCDICNEYHFTRKCEKK